MERILDKRAIKNKTSLKKQIKLKFLFYGLLLDNIKALFGSLEG